MEITVTEFFAKFGSTIGAFIGASVPVGVIIWRFYKSQNKKQETTRRAFKADLKHTKDILEQILPKIEDKKGVPGGVEMYLSPVVFESLVDRLGALTVEENEKLIQCYRSLAHTKSEIERFIRNRESYDDEAHATLKGNLESDLFLSNEAISVLDKHLDC